MVLMNLPYIRPKICPSCEATDPSEILGKLREISRTRTDALCLDNWHTRYPDKPTIVELNHPESPSKPGAPHSSQ